MNSHGAGTAVGHRFTETNRRGVQCLAHRLGQVGGGTLLEHLLVAALGRAVALAECYHPALAVAEQLYFQVTGAGDIGLDEYAGIAEVALAESAHRVEGARQLGAILTDLHADPAATGGGLEHHRIADALGLGEGRRGAVEQTGAGHQRHLGALGNQAGFMLEAEAADLPWPSARGTPARRPRRRR
jgi:hypothetical protein